LGWVFAIAGKLRSWPMIDFSVFSVLVGYVKLADLAT
jgi:hypothetical protein